jgi:nicotinamide mononucleotide (NMN) deamidase PncC
MSLLNNLQQLCIEKGVSIAVAESCTAGLIASKLTTLAGSSSYFN